MTFFNRKPRTGSRRQSSHNLPFLYSWELQYLASWFTEGNYGFLGRNLGSPLLLYVLCWMTAPPYTYIQGCHYYTIYCVYSAHLWSGKGKFSQPVCSDPCIFFWLDQAMLTHWHIVYAVLILLFFVCLCVFLDERYCRNTVTTPVPIVFSGVCNILPFVSMS